MLSVLLRFTDSDYPCCYLQTLLSACAISTYHHKRCEFEPANWLVYEKQHCVIKFVSVWRQVVALFSLVSFTNKTDRHYIKEILLKGTSNAITLTRYWITRPIKKPVHYKIGPFNLGSLPTRSTILYNLSFCRFVVYKRHATIPTTTVVIKLNCIS